MNSWTILTIFLASGIHCYLLDGLVKDIFKGYEPAVRPRCDGNGATNVTMEMALRQLVDLNEPLQILNTIVWIRLWWIDCRLTWNTTRYSGLEEVVVPQNRVWVPDITLYDNADKNQLGNGEFNLLIKSDGRISFNFPSFVKSLCAVDATHFPFDFQACKLTFGSWAYSGNKVNLSTPSGTADLTSFVKNTEWRIESVPVIRLDTSYGTDSFPTVTFVIKLERRPLFYVLNLIFPCILISSVAILGFLLPPASGEKVNLEITVMLSLAVFQLIVLEMMPPTGDRVPFISLYFTLSMVLVGLSCLATVIVLNVHFKGGDDAPLPAWVKHYLYIPLAKITFTNLADYQLWRESYIQSRKESGTFVSSSVSSPKLYRAKSFHREKKLDQPTSNGFVYENHNSECMEEIPNIENRYTDLLHSTEYDQNYDTVQPGSSKNDLLSLVERVNSTLESINRLVTNNNVVHVHRGATWKIFALILDRFFLALYIISLLVCFLSMSVKYIITKDTPELWSSENVI